MNYCNAGFAAAMFVFGFAAILAAAEPVRLTHDGARKIAPVFADGGKEIVFASHNIPNRVSLMRLSFAEDKQELVDSSITAHQFDPDISTDGRYLCFALSSGSPQMVLVVRDNVKKTETQFKPQGARSTVRGPKITPDNKHVVFTLSGPGGKQIARVDMQCKNLKKLTQSIGTNCWPALSPDGKRIAYCSSRDGSFNIYVMNTDSNGLRQLTHHKLRVMRPTWSPDGKSIAFTSVRDGNHELYVIDTDGANLRRLTNHASRDDYPVWHPDGKRILFVSQRDGQSDLYFMDASK